jgi:hypothetical protein
MATDGKIEFTASNNPRRDIGAVALGLYFSTFFKQIQINK